MGRSQNRTRTPNICPLGFFKDRNFTTSFYHPCCPPSTLLLMGMHIPPHFRPPKGPVQARRAPPGGPARPPCPELLGPGRRRHSVPTHVRHVHRGRNDENVVLSANGGRCWLIDFGSAGIVRRNGRNSFSGTCVVFSSFLVLSGVADMYLWRRLDYASPEILPGMSHSTSPASSPLFPDFLEL